MAKIVENGKITCDVPGTVMQIHTQNVRSGWITKEIMRGDCNRYVMIAYRTRTGERTLYIWP